MDSSPQRAYYRIRYPVAARPRLVLGNRIIEVQDVAEYGMSFFLPEDDPPDEDDRITGTLHLGDRWSGEVEGDVVWVTGGLAGVRFREPIPFKVVLEEQLFLRTHYPGRRG